MAHTGEASVKDLAEAVKARDAAQVRAILHTRPELVNMDTSASNEHRAIHHAALRRDPAMVRLLMEAGADARKGIYPHRDATSAFTIARDREYEEIVAVIEGQEQLRREELSRSDAAVTAVAHDRLSDAIAEGDGARVRELIEADRAVLRKIGRNGGLLTVAVKHGQVEMARLLLDLGADVDERITLEELETPTPSWGMPLWNAALAGDVEMTRLLLDRGADPNANVYASGWPLRNAWHHEDDTVKRLLLERGARLEPYMIAELHDVDAAKRLLDEGASEELARELVVSAADHGCPEIVALALPHLTWPKEDAQWHWVLIQPIGEGAGTTPITKGTSRV